MAHITILASLGGPQSIENSLIHGKPSTLAENPSLQVCGRTRRGEIHAFISGELAGWIEETHTWQHVVKRKSHSPNCARILGVLYIVEPLCSTLQEAEAHPRRKTCACFNEL